MALRWIENETRFVADVADLYNNTQGQLNLSTSADQTSELQEGLYDVWCSADCYIKIHTTANDVTTSTGYLLRADNTVTVLIRHKHKIGGIVAGGTPTLRYHKVT